MFGYKLVKKKNIDELHTKVNELIAHIGENAGFVDERGILSNSGRDFQLNDARQAHWSTFYRLIDTIRAELREMYT